MTDLFGEEARTIEHPGAYAGTPGRGPKGKTCRDCAHYCRVSYQNVYLKCGLMRAIWTGGAATDIKAGTPACEHFEEPR